MLESVRQLLLRALPTFAVVAFLYFYLRATLFKPLEETLDRRKAATAGTRQSAGESLKRAEEKAAEYEEKLRAARAELYQEQEQLRKKWRSEQTAALAAAREKVEATLKEARARLAERKEEAAATLETASHALADRIVEAVVSGRSL